MKGRKPLPTELKVLRGTNRKKGGTEPTPEKGIPFPPHSLSGEARKEWFRISAALNNLGLLTQVDRAALAGYCQHWGRWCQINNALKGKKLTAAGAAGQPVAHPLIAQARMESDAYRKFLVEFGMTPSSRARLVIETKEEALTSELDEILAMGDG